MQEFYFALLGDEVKLPIYVTGVGSTDPEWHCVRPSGHVYNQIIYAARGDGLLIVDGVEYKIPKGWGFYLPANILMNIWAWEMSLWKLTGFPLREAVLTL